jgi:hypothetical protein
MVSIYRSLFTWDGGPVSEALQRVPGKPWLPMRLVDGFSRRLLKTRRTTSELLALAEEAAQAEDFATAAAYWREIIRDFRRSGRPLPTAYILKRRDIYNLQQWGRQAPLSAERIWVNVPDVTHVLRSECLVPRTLYPPTGIVCTAPWPHVEAVAIEDNMKIHACILHWAHGVPWEETGIYDYMLAMIAKHGRFDGCTTRDEIAARYKKMDRMYANIRANGSMKPASEFNGGFRERDGVLFHVGPDGSVCFGGMGHHRFAIAHLLRLTIPAQLGIVHSEAIGMLGRFRAAPWEGGDSH